MVLAIHNAYLEASTSTRLAGSPSRHLLLNATWLTLLSAGRDSACDSTAIGVDPNPSGGLESEDSDMLC